MIRTDSQTDGEDQPPAQREANRLTLEGIDLLSKGQAQQALANFERAIACRESLPLDADPLYRWGLAAGWIQRGNALSLLNGESEEIVASFQQGISQLSRLEPTPAVLNRAAIAWNNQGLHLENVGQKTEAADSYRAASHLLIKEENSECQLTRATALLHLARLSSPDKAIELSEAARALTEGRTKDTILAAQIFLKASHHLCKRRCQQLENRKIAEGGDDWISKTTDFLEEALQVANYWNNRHSNPFHAEAFDLFRLGLRIYRICQPHFLVPFIEDHLAATGPLPENFRQAALAALESAHALQNQATLLIGDKLEASIELRQQIRSLARRLEHPSTSS